MFSKTFSIFSLVLSLLISKYAAVPDESVMYYDIKNLSLAPPYITQSLRNDDWSFGNATVMEVNNYIRLTPNLPSKQGWLWSKVPLISNNWEIEFEYKIHSKKGKNNNNYINGDGFAFFYTSERAIEGNAFGNIQNFNGLGIFFDTFANEEHGYPFPRISAMIGDGEMTYNTENDGEETISEGCSMRIRDQNSPTKVKIVHVRNNYLEVSLTNDEYKDFTSCFVIKNIELPKSGYIGFSASTGEYTVDNHDIISVTTKGILDKFVGKTGQRKVLRSDQSISTESSSSIKSSIFVIGLLLIICGIVINALRGNKNTYGNKYKHYGHYN